MVFFIGKMLNENHVVIIVDMKYYFGGITRTEMIEWVTYN